MRLETTETRTRLAQRQIGTARASLPPTCLEANQRQDTDRPMFRDILVAIRPTPQTHRSAMLPIHLAPAIIWLAVQRILVKFINLASIATMLVETARKILSLMRHYSLALIRIGDVKVRKLISWNLLIRLPTPVHLEDTPLLRPFQILQSTCTLMGSRLDHLLLLATRILRGTTHPDRHPTLILRISTLRRMRITHHLCQGPTVMLRVEKVT